MRCGVLIAGTQKPLPFCGARSALVSHSTRSMAWRSHGFDNESLVAALERNGLVRNARVADAMRAVDRGRYVPGDSRGQAYMDTPLPIGYGQTISAPHMHAQCGELLESVCTPGANVLDVGSGSGYLTAVLAQLVGPQGRVTGVEVVPELVERSRRTLAADPATRAMVESGAVSVHVAEGSPGWPANAPYDAIHVGAAAATVPRSLVDELAESGVMIIPVGPDGGDQVLMRIHKESGKVYAHELMGVRYVPLVHVAPAPSE